MGYYKHKDKYYICSEFIPERDMVLKPIDFPANMNYLLVPKGLCSHEFMEVTEAEAMANMPVQPHYKATADSTMFTADNNTITIDRS